MKNTKINKLENISLDNVKSLKNTESIKQIFVLKTVPNPIWLSVTEAAKLGGVQNKTVRRAIQNNNIKFKIIGNRYLIDLSSLITFLYTKTKLKNKLNQLGIGQYINKWCG